jgi:Domain of unknown function (DUF4160)
VPTALLIKGFRFYFFSGEGSEPCHIHVKKGNAKGKIWLLPNMEEDYLYGFTVAERKEIELIIKENRNLLIDKWNEHFRK